MKDVSMKALLILGGDIDIVWATDFVKSNNYDKIVAVDGGLSAANLLCIRPDMVVGDFDTISDAELKKYSNESDAKVIRLNPIKDDTDSQYAIRLLIDAGVTELHIIGGNGKRFDHTMANVYMLKMAYENGVKAYMYDEINKIHIIDGCINLKKDSYYGKYISFIQLENPAKNVTMSGFKYNVMNFDFDTAKEYRLGISNEFQEKEASITIGEGKFIVIEVAKN